MMRQRRTPSHVTFHTIQDKDFRKLRRHCFAPAWRCPRNIRRVAQARASSRTWNAETRKETGALRGNEGMRPKSKFKLIYDSHRCRNARSAGPHWAASRPLARWPWPLLARDPRQRRTAARAAGLETSCLRKQRRDATDGLSNSGGLVNAIHAKKIASDLASKHPTRDARRRTR